MWALYSDPNYKKENTSYANYRSDSFYVSIDQVNLYDYKEGDDLKQLETNTESLRSRTAYPTMEGTVVNFEDLVEKELQYTGAPLTHLRDDIREIRKQRKETISRSNSNPVMVKYNRCKVDNKRHISNNSGNNDSGNHWKNGGTNSKRQRNETTGHGYSRNKDNQRGASRT